MLKARTLHLAGRDTGRQIVLTELPALQADRHARRLIASWDGDPAGGVAGLALRHQADLAAMGADALEALAPFVRATLPDGTPFDLNDLADWKNVARIQQAALALHVDFLLGRKPVDVPVSMRAEGILAGEGDAQATFCSPFIAAVLQSDKASYVELETVLSTEDAYNLAELLNIDAIRQWRDAQIRAKGKP
jgi:hypothetical protein